MQKNFQVFSDSDVIAASFGRGESLSDVSAFARSSNHTLVRMEQEHTANLAIIETNSQTLIANTDALITKQKNILLAIKTADCLPILFSHPSGVIGVIHAGRAGTTQHITEQTLQVLKSKFDIVENLTVWFGPRICADCYQVDKKTDEHFDLVSENLKQVQGVYGDSQTKIIVSEHCTAHHNTQWYSYRTEGKGVQMNWFVIGSLLVSDKKAEPCDPAFY